MLTSQFCFYPNVILHDVQLANSSLSLLIPDTFLPGHHVLIISHAKFPALKIPGTLQPQTDLYFFVTKKKKKIVEKIRALVFCSESGYNLMPYEMHLFLISNLSRQLKPQRTC